MLLARNEIETSVYVDGVWMVPWRCLSQSWWLLTVWQKLTSALRMPNSRQDKLRPGVSAKHAQTVIPRQKARRSDWILSWNAILAHAAAMHWSTAWTQHDMCSALGPSEYPLNGYISGCIQCQAFVTFKHPQTQQHTKKWKISGHPGNRRNKRNTGKRQSHS